MHRIREIGTNLCIEILNLHTIKGIRGILCPSFCVCVYIKTYHHISVFITTLFCWTNCWNIILNSTKNLLVFCCNRKKKHNNREYEIMTLNDHNYRITLTVFMKNKLPLLIVLQSSSVYHFPGHGSTLQPAYQSTN